MHFLAYSILLLAGDKHSQLDDHQLCDFKNTINQQYPQLNGVHTSTFSLLDNHYLNVNIMGATNTAMMSRGAILRDHPLKLKCMIQSFHLDLLNKQSELHDTLNDIATEYGTTIQVDCQSKPSITIYGSLDQIEMTRTQILIMLDQQLGLHSDTLEIPCYLHYLVAGRKHHHLQSIMEETGTNIYLTSPFMKLSDIQYMSLPVDERYGTIHLTGTLQGIQRAKDLLMKLTAQKKKSMYHKDSIIKPTKLDWILRYQKDQLSKIMKDNGSVIIFPALGSGCNTITVYAENRVNVERTFRLLNYLQYDIYEVSFIFKQENQLNGASDDISYAVKLFGSLEKLASILNQLSKNSGAEIVYNSENSRLDIVGSNHSVSQACQHISSMSFFKIYQPTCSFSIEMASEQREFISGKKNGKINKIMKTCDVQLSFTPTNEYNVVITLESTDMTKALSGISMLQDELPAETSFYVPEVYHRRIIGVGGKNIQRVMKKYGVYVKFSGAEEFASMGGYFENEHNVVARTPMKNKPNLYLLQEAVMEFIGAEKDKHYTTTMISIPIHLHSLFAHQHHLTLHEIERVHHIRLIWPEKRLGTDQVLCYGPKSLLYHIIDFIQSKIPKEIQFALLLNQHNQMGHLNQQQKSDDITIQWKNNLQEKLDQYFPKAGLQILLQKNQSNNSIHLNTTATRVQWKHVPYSKESTIYRLRYFDQQQQQQQKQHIHLVTNFIHQYCQNENISVEFESDLKYWTSLSNDDSLNDDVTLSSIPSSSSPSSILQYQYQHQQQQETSSYKETNINLPPSPSTSPHDLSQHLHPLSLFDQKKYVGDTTWSSFLYHQGSNENTMDPSHSQDPLQHQPIRALFESIPSTSPPLSTSSSYTAIKPQSFSIDNNHTYGPTMSSPFNSIKPLPSFSSPIPISNTNYQQQHYQLQQQQQQKQLHQQQFLLPSSYYPQSQQPQPKRSFSTSVISSSSTSTSISTSTSSSSSLSSYKDNSWLTPGYSISQIRSSCPDLFLAPDLFASTPLRKPSVTDSTISTKVYHIA
ncbi:hypothetical protein BJ944DRAFT_289386 [Cunninghamella echinulata]|nr:hypothetical protein BJ944DRAFT_289386 [Cunninghamella echinulata]